MKHVATHEQNPAYAHGLLLFFLKLNALLWRVRIHQKFRIMNGKYFNRSVEKHLARTTLSVDPNFHQ